MKLIHDVKIKKLKYNCDERGKVMEILRNDDNQFSGFGQVYITTAYPGVVKAWHYHKHQTDNFAVIKGMMKLVLYDNRDNSPTKGTINEFFVGEYNQILVSIPAEIYHGFKGISVEETIAINVPTKHYNSENPDEYRLDPYDNDIPYDWSRNDG